MISIGGVDATVEQRNAFLDEDPNEYGIGVFDMVDLAWKSSYDARAATYTTPSVIKQWSTKNG